ncbi:MAG: hypothetical protein HYV97_20120 [Bdellovibrio sp.]|nr:hypothetical protein [Bdellovibrio sp.]
MKFITFTTLLLCCSCSATRVSHFDYLLIEKPKEIKLTVLKDVVSAKRCGIAAAPGQYAINWAILHSLASYNGNAYGLANVVVKQDVSIFLINTERCFKVTGNPIVKSSP